MNIQDIIWTKCSQENVGIAYCCLRLLFGHMERKLTEAHVTKVGQMDDILF